MKLNELMKQAAMQSLPPSDLAARVMAQERGRTGQRLRPVTVLAAVMLTLTLSVGAFAGAGLLARYFGAAPDGVAVPEILAARCEGEFYLCYTEAWYSHGKLYLAGQLITPAPLEADRRYVICPTVTVNGVKLTSHDRMTVYPDGGFVQPLTIPDAAAGDTLTLTVLVDAVEDWTDVGSEFNKADVTVYTGACRIELSVTAAAPSRLTEIGYDDGRTTVARIGITPLSVMVEGSGFSGRTAALRLEDGSLVFGYTDETCVIFRFDAPGQAERAAELILADAIYTAPDAEGWQMENPAPIPLK